MKTFVITVEIEHTDKSYNSTEIQEFIQGISLPEAQWVKVMKKALAYLKQFNKNARRYITDEEGFGAFSTSIDNVEKMTDKQLEKDMKSDMELYFGD